jgi:hypothetical protein
MSGMDWIDLTQDWDQWRAVMNTVIKFWVAYNFKKFLSFCTTGDFLRRAQLHGHSCNSELLILFPNMCVLCHSELIYLLMRSTNLL